MASKDGADRAPKDYGAWDGTPIRIPTRSRLHHLEPVGVGTGAVESLTGYFRRLAGSHVTGLHPLATKVIAPLLAPARVWWAGTTTHMFFRTSARGMGGIGAVARDWTAVLTDLTLRDDLRPLTMLPWAGVIAGRGLLRETPAWCPACYEEWSAKGAVVYQPLLWHLAVVTACPRHGRALVTYCPHQECGRAEVLRSTATWPGYCAACAGWLGSAAPPDPGELPDAATLARQSWVVEAIGAMLADAATRERPFTGDDLTAALAACTAIAGGNAELARVTGLGHTVLTGWRRGKRLPSLPLLLHFCHRLDTTPLRLLTDGPPPPGRALAVPTARPGGVIRLDRAAIRASLADQVREPDTPPPSLSEMARRLGCSRGSLERLAPAAARTIAARATAHRTALADAAAVARRDDVRRVTLERWEAGLGTAAWEVKAALPDPTMWWTPDAEDARRSALVEAGGVDDEAIAPPAVPPGPRHDLGAPTPSALALTGEERAALASALDDCPTAERARRLRAVLLLGAGQHPEAVAVAVDASESSIYAWAKAWRQGGLTALDDVHGGTPFLLDASARRLLADLLAVAPTVHGYRRTVWTASMLHAEMTKAGHTIGQRTVQRAAEQLGWHPERNAPVPPPTPAVLLTGEERAALERALDVEAHEPYRRRMRAILLLASGEATRTAAAAVGASDSSLLAWAKTWRRGGLPGLLGRPGVAGTPVLDTAAERLLEKRLSASPGAYGHAATAWTLALLQAELDATGRVVSQGTVWCALKRLGWRCARPGYVKVPP